MKPPRFGIAWGFAAVAFLSATPAEPPLADAAMRRDREEVQALLRQRVDVNAAQGDGMTALHWAAANGDVEIAGMLLRAGANVTLRTRVGAYQPLHLASQAGSAAVVQALLQAGSDTKAKTSSGGSAPLHFAALSGSAATIRALVSGGADLNQRDEEWGRTPLMFAAASNRLEALRALLELGADASITAKVVDMPNRATVDAAARQVRTETLAEFRRQAAPENELLWRPTPAQVQAAMDAAHQVQLGNVVPTAGGGGGGAAAEGGVAGYPDQVGSQGGLTALLYAARQGHQEAVLALLAAGADINQAKDGDNTSPLLIATINGHFDLARVLLERGADPTLAGPAGSTPLFTALNLHWSPRSRFPQPRAQDQQQTTYLELMEALLRAGADPNARLTKQLWIIQYTYDLLGVDFTGASPFWRAAYATDVEAMKLLVAYGADPHVATLVTSGGRGGRGAGAATDPSGLPPVPAGGPGVWPIHAASGVGYGEGYAANAHRHVPDGWIPAVRYLVETLGMDVDARDQNGYTAVHHAAARGDNDLILYLVSKGADVKVVARNGRTTVDMANGPQQRISPFPATIALLESMGAKNNHRCVSC